MYSHSWYNDYYMIKIFKFKYEFKFNNILYVIYCNTNGISKNVILSNPNKRV